MEPNRNSGAPVHYGSREDEPPWHKRPAVVIAGLVVFPPLGIFLAWKHKLWGQQVRTVASIASAVWFAIALVMGQVKKREDAEKAAEQAAVAAKAAEDEAAKKKADAEQRQREEAAARDEAKRKHETEPLARANKSPTAANPAAEATPKTAEAPPRPEEIARTLCRDMTFTSFSGGVLTCGLEDEAMDDLKSYTISGHTELEKLIKGFDSLPELKSITVVEVAKFNDERGNEKKLKVAEFKLSRATAKKINWDNVKWRNIPKIIDYAWAKPGVPHLVD